MIVVKVFQSCVFERYRVFLRRRSSCLGALQHVLIKQVMQVAVRAPNERRRFEPTCMIVNSIHLRGLYD